VAEVAVCKRDVEAAAVAEELAGMMSIDAASSKEWQAQARAKWQELDVDESGSLEVAELVPLCNWAFEQLRFKFESDQEKHRAVDELVQHFLANASSAALSFNQFAVYFQKTLTDVEQKVLLVNEAYADGYDQSEAAAMFRKLDKDENGFLDGDELEALVAWVHEQFRPGGKPMVIPESRCSLRIHVRYSSTKMACPPPPCAVGQGAGARGGAASAPAGRGRGRRGWEAVFLRVRRLLCAEGDRGTGLRAAGVDRGSWLHWSRSSTLQHAPHGGVT
jgi:Ca2+-binding EF-hand superfamily protein